MVGDKSKWHQFSRTHLPRPGALILSAIAAWAMARHLVSPIIRMGQVARTLAAGDYSSRIKQTHSDELGTLIDNFNFMANNLELADKAERQWVSDTSHELQTPISVLRAGIEALQDGVRKASKKTCLRWQKSSIFSRFRRRCTERCAVSARYRRLL